MSSILGRPTVPPAPTVAERFRELARRWREQTNFLSSMTAMVDHPDYQAIVALGPEVVPVLLRELRDDPDWWFVALQQLTGANPVAETDRGNLDRMAAAWLHWGRENGYPC